ncbi:lactose regulatory protein lac9 and GAL4-like protein [Cadophora gregata]|uniref:lactose regulatory protein lac9 and GAL4-like protein n=1 Tax=Cadophora gregata TaxID=51156 RepID=UPI0026DB7B1F|nr:lactose regulatory protein lac9 and GAL4-like protein [Cadophora gregata]KAK0123818.1 lactose regulatory protein lac9 and GAL4-like protein [Cadophora gregata]KAK0130162.1 lactose regulatory protein lac9 and GAL4-like protein [Cadophora gregata f. sp. sojae]
MPGEEAPRFACDECRIRKFKCTKELPSCAVCVRQGKQCIYSPKAERTPLTRSNLTVAEDRIRQLEAAFAELHPDVDLDQLLETTSDKPLRNSRPQNAETLQPEDPDVKSRGFRRESASPGAEEALPQQADGFDWTEETTLSGLSDGMAALSIKPEGTGYLGATSSVMPLRALLSGDPGMTSSEKPPFGQPINTGGFEFPYLAPPLSGVSEQVFIDAYFCYYHTAYPFLHEATFRAQYSGELLRPKGKTWPILRNAVLAIGSWCIGDDDSTIDRTFYQEVNSLWQDDASVFEAGNLSLVQALLLLSNYTQKTNKPNTGWNYLGLAVRMALSLGLHKEFPEWKISPLQREMRRRVWWGLYIFDSGASITFGRPVLLPEESNMDTNQVLNIHEQDLTAATTSLPQEILKPTAYSALRAQAALHLTTNQLYQRLISTPGPTSSELLGLQAPLVTWQRSIPAYFQVHSPELQANDAFILARYRLSWRTWNLRIILFRPTVLRWATHLWATGPQKNLAADEADEKCRMLCLESARDTIASISEYMAGNLTSRLGSWYMLYFLFQAGLIPVIFLITMPTHPSAQSWLEDLRITKNLLSFVAVNNRLAERCLETIDRMCAPLLNASEPEILLQDPNLFNDVQSMFVGEQGDGSDFMDWTNFGLQWGI